MCGDGLTVYRAAVVKGCTPRDGAPGCLLRMGLLVPPVDDPTVLVPVSPEVAKAELVRPIEESLERERLHAQQIDTSFVPVNAIYTAAKREHAGWATPIIGEQVIHSTLAHAVRECREELMTVQPGGDRLSYDLEDLDHVRGSVRHRALYQHAVRTHAATLRHIERLVEAGGEVRTLDHVFDRLIIIDRTVAYIPGHDDRRTTALEIKQPAIVSFLVQVFEESWERGSSVDPGASRGVEPDIADEIQRAIMRMLVDGHTDEAIARRLGTSRRTVAAHVSRIAATLQSRSRAQLGYLIATTGLLPLDELAESGGCGRVPA
ncbi:helix-turn-helix transcriptional regulator [Streptomyces antimicrobicus]|uniref:LuxR C-terminal-related transcriptional regulator n=1 Tax=Streptomyces antimicrobicus TaxID=2883108 RepID=A0ABS8B4Q8_9ACTN|nr:LuxR C-terminal-related transcriptional regulator [Streptomyces antimicrobicus]MCB5179553.1 LuxR C-terminal-related transcriptional regulator [Streptomyces antimicrobicus]